MRCDQCDLQIYKGDDVAVDSNDRVMHAGCYSLGGLAGGGGGGASKARKAKTKPKAASNFLGTMVEEVVKGVMKGLQPQPQPQPPPGGNPGGSPSLLTTLAPIVSAALGSTKSV